MMRNVIQISPTYPPNMGGIGHYAVLLASSLIAKGIKSKFLISDHLIQRANNQNLFGRKTSYLSTLLEIHNAKKLYKNNSLTKLALLISRFIKKL